MGRIPVVRLVHPVLRVSCLYTLVRGATVTENNYWNEYADTLEWTLPCPPPEHTFEQLPKQEEWDHSHNH